MFINDLFKNKNVNEGWDELKSRAGDVAKKTADTIVSAGSAAGDAVSGALDVIPKPFDEKTYQDRVSKPYPKIDGPKKTNETSKQDQLHQRHQEIRKQSGKPHPNYYKELRATFDLPDDERWEKTAELKKKYNIKESLRPGERHHFEINPATGKREYKGIRGDRTDAPNKRDSSGDAAERADRERKAHIQHDRRMTEQEHVPDRAMRKAVGKLVPGGGSALNAVDAVRRYVGGDNVGAGIAAAGVLPAIQYPALATDLIRDKVNTDKWFPSDEEKSAALATPQADIVNGHLRSADRRTMMGPVTLPGDEEKQTADWLGKTLRIKPRDTKEDIEETYGGQLHTKHKKNRFKQIKKIKQTQRKAHGFSGLDESGCTMTEEGRSCPVHGLAECPGYGMTEGSTDDSRFQKMMGNIQKSTPTLVTGYVALEFASERKSKKIKGVTRNGKPIPDVINDPEEELSGKIEFTPDQLEQQLMSIGRKYGWDSIEPGQGRGYTEMFFETSREYTSDSQNHLAANIVKTVNAINKFFNSMNSSLQATGLPGYTTSVWQGMGPPDDINQITDLSQMTKIAKSTGANSQAKNTRTSDDVGVELGNAILAHYKEFGPDGGYSSSQLNQAAKIAKIYITQGERAGLQAQMKAGVVGEMIDELISDAGLSGIRTIWELDEMQGVAEARKGDTNFGSTVTQSSWVVYDGSKVKRFKTRDGAKAYAAKNGGKVASSEFYADNVQKQGVAEAMNEDIERYVEALGRAGYEVNEEKVRLDPKCWKGKKIGSPKTKMKGGVRVNNCVPK